MPLLRRHGIHEQGCGRIGDSRARSLPQLVFLGGIDDHLGCTGSGINHLWRVDALSTLNQIPGRGGPVLSTIFKCCVGHISPLTLAVMPYNNVKK